jgi:hypothetical protein
MLAVAVLGLAPVCVLGKVVIEPTRMNKVVVNIADDKTRKMVTKMPPNRDGSFMMFLDAGTYRMRLVGLKGEAIGPLRTLVVENGKLNRICVPSTTLKPGFGRLEGIVDVSPLVPASKEGVVPMPPFGMYKGCSAILTKPDGSTAKLSAVAHGLFTADLKPGDYTLTSDYKTPNPITPVKVTIKAGQLSAVRIPVDSGIR